VNRKVILTIILMIILAASLILFSTGGKIAGIFLNDYSVSDDGNAMTLRVGVASSMGYVRTLKERQEENKKYITFYSTYGLNSKLGSNNEFQIDLNPSINEIYFYRGEEGYVLILQKNDESKKWQLVK
jgi:hypothetical protein